MMNMNDLIFLTYFNLKKGHYNIPPKLSCKTPSALSSTTPGSWILMLLLVVPPIGKINFTGGFKDELNQCCYSTISLNPPALQVGVTNISAFISFSLSKLSRFISKIIPYLLVSLKNVPSVLHKNDGRRC